jgi:8-oxo-dGTP diphosphatase
VNAPRLVVGAVLVDRLDQPSRVLAARRTRPPALAGRWELPGGKVEPGEQPEEALHRELAEELGVVVRLGAELRPTTGTAWPLTAGLEMRAWWCELVAGQPVTGEAHDAVCWSGAADVTDLAWLDPDRPLVDQVAAVLADRRSVVDSRHPR